MKLSIRNQVPRNPLVALALFRKAGSHRRTARSDRQLAQRALRRELARLVNPSP
jgi:hypothetical protein